MSTLTDLVGIQFFETAFCASLFLLLYATSCQLVIPSCVLFVIIFISYRMVRKIGAKRICYVGKYVLITGCDSGFGNALARRLDIMGMNVFATCLTETSRGAINLTETGSKRMHVLQMDVTSDDSVAACLQKVKTICQKEGIWAIVNNAGISSNGDVELQSMANYKRVAEVNLFGMVRVCKAFLPLVRKRKGRVINVTSVQGLLAMYRVSAYSISKFGGEAFSDSLRLEMKRFGVKVIVIEPGAYGEYTGLFDTENANRYLTISKQNVDSASEEIREAYGEEYLNTLLQIPKQISNSDKLIKPVTDALEDAILNTQPKSRYLVDGRTWLDKFCVMARLNHICPEYIMDRLYFWVWPLPKSAFIQMQKNH